MSALLWMVVSCLVAGGGSVWLWWLLRAGSRSITPKTSQHQSNREINKTSQLNRTEKQLAYAGRGWWADALPRALEIESNWVESALSTSMDPTENSESVTVDRLACVDPATGQSLGQVNKCPVTALGECVQNARRAQQQWCAEMSFELRRQLLRDLQDFIVHHQCQLAAICSRDTGKTFVDAFFGEILTTLEKLRWVCQHGESVLQPEYRSVGPLTMHKNARVEYHPRGVVAAIVSWNYPFHNAFGPLIASLFAGNAILIKCSEQVAWSSTRYFAPIIHSLLLKYGQSTDLVQFLVGEGDLGAALVNSGVDKVTFIGSPEVGRKVMETAAKTLTPVTLELGGKDAAILCDDADLKQAVPIVMRGCFQNVGQNCVGLERILVHASLYDAFVETVTPLVQALRVGPPLECQTDCGAITIGKQLDHVDRLVQDAVERGARCLVGGKRFNCPAAPQGTYYQPTLLVDVTPDMLIAQKEVFGPVMTVMKFYTDTEAVDVVNSAPYGLGGSVFSANVSRAEFITARIQTGMANINDFAVNYLCQSLPFGGCKVSGFGRFAGVEGLRDECVLKAVTTDKLGGLRTSIPKPLDYPIGKGSQDFCLGLAMTVYARDWWSRLEGVQRLIRACLTD